MSYLLFHFKDKSLIIGVAGGTASGKTSVSRILYDAVPQIGRAHV